MAKVYGFRDEYYFLSNMYPAKVMYQSVVYPTAEHAFQAAKCANEADRERILAEKSPFYAKHIGRTVKMIPNWNVERVYAMYQILKSKFSNPELRSKLLATGTAQLVEANQWHDHYWGVDYCTGKGQNMLGRILMKVRDEC